jgi:hypothetical protein
MNIVNEFGNATSLLTDRLGHLKVSTVNDTVDEVITVASGKITLAGGTSTNPRVWETYPADKGGSLITGVIDASTIFKNNNSFVVSITCSRDNNSAPEAILCLLGFNDDVLSAGLFGTTFYQRACALWNYDDTFKQFCRAAGTEANPSGFDSSNQGINQWVITSPPITIRHKYYKLTMSNDGTNAFDININLFSAD